MSWLNRRCVATVLVGVCLLSVVVQESAADALSTDFIELNYVFESLDFADGTIEGDGISVRASKVLFSDLSLVGEYRTQEFSDVQFVDVNQQHVSLGFAYRHQFSWQLDAYAQLSANAILTDEDGARTDELGFGAEFGIRSIPFANLENLELEGFIEHVDVENMLSNTLSATYVGARARWRFNDYLSVGGSLKASDSSMLALATIRLDFDGVRFGF